MHENTLGLQVAVDHVLPVRLVQRAGPGARNAHRLAADAGDSTLIARIRGLGFAGIITEGDHHVRHHLAIARGDAAAHEH
ncbi:MAG: hypothetical protein ACYC5V_04895 [Gemmatimonadaceae bacterium]